MVFKAVIWDFGGVITSSPFDAFNAYEAARGLPHNTIRGINAINPDRRRQDQDFARICAIWGAIWLLITFSVLHESAIAFGPSVLGRIGKLTGDSLFAMLA